ncbi:MAG: ParB N-terminal domain-containing protein, partial [Nitrososphaerota archaeon]
MMKMIRVPVDSLKPKIRVRRELGDLDKLAESIKEYGVLEPLVVSESDDGGYEVVLGLRRYLAALRAGVDVVPAISIGKIGLLEALEIIFKEDGLRKKLTLDERA